jgi:hypothetical protein
MADAKGNLHRVYCAWVDASLQSSNEHLGRVTRDKSWNEEIERNRGPERDQVKANAA